MYDSIKDSIKDMEPHFMKGTQAVATLISLTFRENELPDCNLYDIFYFSCVFLGVLISRLPASERLKYADQVPSLLKEPAVEGLSFFNEIRAVRDSLDTKQEMQDTMAKLGLNEQQVDVISSISTELKSMEIKENNLWERLEHYKMHEKIINKMESALIIKFNILIDTTLQLIPMSVLDDDNRELVFLVISIANFGLLAGYGAGIFHKEPEEFMQSAIYNFHKIVSITSSQLLH